MQTESGTGSHKRVGTKPMFLALFPHFFNHSEEVLGTGGSSGFQEH